MNLSRALMKGLFQRPNRYICVNRGKDFFGGLVENEKKWAKVKLGLVNHFRSINKFKPLIFQLLNFNFQCFKRDDIEVSDRHR